MTSITHRPPNEAETELIQERVNQQTADVFVVLVIAFGSIFLLIWIHEQMLGNQNVLLGRLVAVLVGLFFTLRFLYKDRYQSTQSRRLLIQDVEEHVVQRIDVENPRVVGLTTSERDVPYALCFELSPNVVLYVDERIPEPRCKELVVNHNEIETPDDFGDRFLSLPDPFGFPSTVFTLVRLPRSGVVLWVEVKGEYLPPTRFVHGFPIQYDLCESELLTGTLADLESILSKADERRKREAVGLVDQAPSDQV